ncbi:hypothetical protein K3553_14100 [Leisingera aquaemixtae]|uniref:hypothetical protein n=1 Tax=Leisingera aquaemixtae TaxID=1396826 RepID=UPI0021A6C944|nr:hypothetical protein [Leisingera aquaemixtae]UWQ24089.1 hypothetical protein K3553_14100 [Leisingera aquaemixtae]
MIVRLLLQTAALLFRAGEQPKLSFEILAKPPPQQPQAIKPENSVFGRRRSQTGILVPAVFSAPWRVRTASQISCSTIRNCGTSVIVHSLSGFRREMRLPVCGSFT